MQIILRWHEINCPECLDCNCYVVSFPDSLIDIAVLTTPQLVLHYYISSTIITCQIERYTGLINMYAKVLWRLGSRKNILKVLADRQYSNGVMHKICFRFSRLIILYKSLACKKSVGMPMPKPIEQNSNKLSNNSFCSILGLCWSDNPADKTAWHSQSSVSNIDNLGNCKNNFLSIFNLQFGKQNCSVSAQSFPVRISHLIKSGIMPIIPKMDFLCYTCGRHKGEQKINISTHCWHT